MVGSSGYVAYTDLMIGILYTEQGEYGRAEDHLRQALALADALGDPRWQAYGLLNLGATAQARGSYKEAHRYLEQSLALFERARDQHGASRSRHILAGLSENVIPLPGQRGVPGNCALGNLPRPPQQVIIGSEMWRRIHVAGRVKPYPRGGPP
jgi:tetratricopeptide (TPR) repeat protein